MQAFKNLTRKTVFDITSLAWPMAFNAVLLQSVTLIDLLLIASLGEVSLAAFGVAGAIVTFIIGIQVAIASGTQFVLSRAIGAGDIKKVGVEVAAAWIVNLAFSLLAMLLLLFGADPLVRAIIADESVAVQATSYIEISLCLLIFSSFSQVIVVYFNSYKNTRIPLYGFLLEIPFNVVCSAILIYGLWGAPEMGLAGAAWGSVAAIFIRFGYLAYRFKQEVDKGRVGGFGAVNYAATKLHLLEVTPVVSNFAVLLTGQMMFQVLFAQLSVSAFAAITLIMPWIKIGGLFVNSWAKASTIFVSQFIGKGDVKSIKPFVLQSSLVATLMSIVMMFCYFLFSQSLPHIYNNLSPETITALAIIAPSYILIPIFRTSNMFCGNMIRAMGESYSIVRINFVTLWLIALPTGALLIYLDAPLLMVFSIILFDEMMKFYKFRKTLMRTLNSYVVL
ncbi:MATE family efflux transporter [Leucothrix arctica]|uniref:MATE family efflux transporter n=1 Tax=Leucothrix arctica TaxID=1481894 RepID=A0A317C5L5_9GAMM|nr:MATE family efflux transporter [Leucothrix arctica]PWQ93955.1 MATE family efflux transporter [Leucothrix arctica]